MAPRIGSPLGPGGRGRRLGFGFFPLICFKPHRPNNKPATVRYGWNWSVSIPPETAVLGKSEATMSYMMWQGASDCLALVMSLWLNMFDTYPGVQKIRPKNKVLVLLIVPGKSVLS